MFLVINKYKIYTYLTAISTVFILFVVAANLNINKNENVIQTSANKKELPIYNVLTSENKIALTLNCAWNADDIDEILKILEANETKLTFFIVGDWADKYPEEVKKIADAGHEIGNHSDTHPHVNNLTSEQNIKEIKKCSDKIEKITGKKTYLYRTPYGEYNNTVINASKKADHISIQWNLDTLDYTGLEGNEMWKRIDGKLSNGSIILMHNGTKHTADSLDMIIKNIKKQGFEIVKISDLIFKDNYTINSNGTQKSI